MLDSHVMDVSVIIALRLYGTICPRQIEGGLTPVQCWDGTWCLAIKNTIGKYAAGQKPGCFFKVVDAADVTGE